jgi:HSP20 family protein
MKGAGKMTQTAVVPVMGKVHDEIDRVFNRFFGNGGFTEPLLRPMVIESIEGAIVPVLDLTESDKEFLARLEVPGIPKENVTIQLNGDVLTISGERQKLEERKGETYLWREQRFGKFTRTLRLPAPVMVDKVEAIYKDGVLEIKLPKLAPVPVNRIPIK